MRESLNVKREEAIRCKEITEKLLSQVTHSSESWNRGYETGPASLVAPQVDPILHEAVKTLLK